MASVGRAIFRILRWTQCHAPWDWHCPQILEDAGIPRIRFYDLRYTHASLLIAEGVHPKRISERLGHASIKLTMDLGHLFDGSDKESADRMQKLFGKLLGDDDAASDEKVVVIPDRRKPA